MYAGSYLTFCQYLMWQWHLTVSGGFIAMSHPILQALRVVSDKSIRLRSSDWCPSQTVVAFGHPLPTGNDSGIPLYFISVSIADFGAAALWPCAHSEQPYAVVSVQRNPSRQMLRAPRVAALSPRAHSELPRAVVSLLGSRC